jgi:hypothetical protein
VLLIASPIFVVAVWLRGLFFGVPRERASCFLPHSDTSLGDALEPSQPLDPVHVMVTYCSGGAIQPLQMGFTAVRSVIAARESGYSSDRKFVFHLVADPFVFKVIAKWRNSSVPGDVSLHDIGIFSEM